MITSDNTKLWRYYDLIKFLTLIGGELYFARADKFRDKYEGAIPKRNYLDFLQSIGNSEDEQQKEKIEKSFVRLFNEKKKKATISCWHINDGESAAMWEVYSRSGQGIAVSTTLGKLKKLEQPEGYEMEMFPLNYIDFDKEYRPEYLLYELLPFKNKRKEFEFEKEFRMMLYQPSQNKIESAYNDLPPEGVKLKINSSEFVDEIIASPHMEKYEVAEIQKLLDLINRQNGTEHVIKRSCLYDRVDY